MMLQEEMWLLLVMSHLYGKLWMLYDMITAKISPLKTSGVQCGYLA